MKKYTVLYTGHDKTSYFSDENIEIDSVQPLGFYSKEFATKHMKFRTFKAGLTYDWHTAPQSQFIIYLEGEVEIIASGGERKIFKTGDILFANDLTGKGHITRTLTDGRSIVITAG